MHRPVGPLAPVEFRAGHFQSDAGGYWYYLANPYSSGSIPDITDGSLATSVHAIGRDGVQGALVTIDTGTFYVLRYKIDPAATLFNVQFTAKFSYAVQNEQFLLNAILPNSSPGGGDSDPILFTAAKADQITTFGVTFSKTGNSGNEPAWNSGLNRLMDKDGYIWLVLTGGFVASMDNPGAYSSDLYEVNAMFIPEPSPAALIFATVLPLAAWSLRRRKSQI